MLTESLILAAAGGVLGAFAAQWALAAIVLKAPLDIPGLQYIHMDLSALAFVALVSIGSGMIRSVASIGKEVPAPDPGLGAFLYSIGYGKVNCKEFHGP